METQGGAAGRRVSPQDTCRHGPPRCITTVPRSAPGVDDDVPSLPLHTGHPCLLSFCFTQKGACMRRTADMLSTHRIAPHVFFKMSRGIRCTLSRGDRVLPQGSCDMWRKCTLLLNQRDHKVSVPLPRLSILPYRSCRDYCVCIQCIYIYIVYTLNSLCNIYNILGKQALH